MHFCFAMLRVNQEMEIFLKQWKIQKYLNIYSMSGNKSLFWREIKKIEKK